MKIIDFTFNCIEAFLFLFITNNLNNDETTHQSKGYLHKLLFCICYALIRIILSSSYVLDLLLLFILCILYLRYYKKVCWESSILICSIFIISMEAIKQLILIPYIRLGILDTLGIFGIERKLMISFSMLLIKLITCYWLNKEFQTIKMEHIDTRSLVTLCLPFSTIICLRIIYFPTYFDNIQKWIYGEDAMMTLLGISTILSLVATIWHINFLQQTYDIKRMESLMEHQYKMIETKTQQDQLVMRMYHDIKNQLNSLCNTNNNEIVVSHIKEINKQISEYEIIPHTSNQILNTLLHDKSLQANQLDIDIIMIINFTSGDFISSIDLCAIFGNILDNAIEAANKVTDTDKRKIELKVTDINGFLVIRSENYFEGTLIRNGDKLETTKENKQLHGIGMQSINFSVQKYGGEVVTEVKEDVFILKIIIPIPKN